MKDASPNLDAAREGVSFPVAAVSSYTLPSHSAA
jgi:hypothetical protein